MTRLTSRHNNFQQRIPLHAAVSAAVPLGNPTMSTPSKVASAFGLLLVLLVRQAAALPMPAHVTAKDENRAHVIESIGCCVSYGLTYTHEECCHEFEEMKGAQGCTVRSDWVGGGKRYHASSCDVTEQLTRYAPADGKISGDSGADQAAGSVLGHAVAGTDSVFSVLPGILPVVISDDMPIAGVDADETAAQDSINIAISAASTNADTVSTVSGCCVSYGLGSGLTECCHEFSFITKEDYQQQSSLPSSSFAILTRSEQDTHSRCETPPGWTGGGKRFYPGKSCEETRLLSQYSSSGTEPEGTYEALAATEAIGSVYQQAILGEDLRDTPNPFATGGGGDNGDGGAGGGRSSSRRDEDWFTLVKELVQQERPKVTNLLAQLAGGGNS